jgi:hypothetical protein
MERKREAVISASGEGEQLTKFIRLISENKNRWAICFLSQGAANFYAIE